MKRFLIFAFLLFTFATNANTKDSTIYYSLPDSVKAVSFLADLTVHASNKKKYWIAGIKVDGASLFMQSYRRKKVICFRTNANLNNIARGLNTGLDLKEFDITFNYDWQKNDSCRLLIAQATDSAGNLSLYSGYVFLPREKKWKLIGTGKLEGRWTSIRRPSVFYIHGKKQTVSVNTIQVWCQRQNGSWKNMLQKDYALPVVNLYCHVDSLEQLQIDENLIIKAIAENKTDAKQSQEGIYYAMIKEGTGRQVSVNDTVTVHYKGYLFSNNSVFDETKDKPATFPLKRLVMGWQIGVPLCKVGGKIKILIPSNLAYSIRTRAAKIPPNSILVFEVEVVDAKAPQ